jgi:DNA-binding response OmpR family regulator
MERPTLSRIMVVDDDPDLQRIVRLGLERGGDFTVKLCDTGGQAIREVSRFRPDVVLLDVVLDDMSGRRAFKAIRNASGEPPVPVIFMTSRTLPEHIKEYSTMGAIGVIGKPLNPLKLAGLVMAIWEKSPPEALRAVN